MSRGPGQLVDIALYVLGAIALTVGATLVVYATGTIDIVLGIVNITLGVLIMRAVFRP